MFPPEVSPGGPDLSFAGVAIEQLLGQRGVVAADLLLRRSVCPREVIDVRVVFAEQRFVVRHLIVLAEEPPYPVAILLAAVVPLMELQVGEFVDQRLVDPQLLVAVGARRLVLVEPDRAVRNSVMARWGFPSRAGSPLIEATI